MNNEELIKIAKSVSMEKELTKAATIGGVGSALITKEGNVYKGTCLGSACESYCAEFSAIATMLTEGESEIGKIVAVDSAGKILPPCGKCRELIYQINAKNLETEIMISEAETIKLKALLPKRWIEL